MPLVITTRVIVVVTVHIVVATMDIVTTANNLVLLKLYLQNVSLRQRSHFLRPELYITDSLLFVPLISPSNTNRSVVIRLKRVFVTQQKTTKNGESIVHPTSFPCKLFLIFNFFSLYTMSKTLEELVPCVVWDILQMKSFAGFLI